MKSKNRCSRFETWPKSPICGCILTWSCAFSQSPRNVAYALAVPWPGSCVISPVSYRFAHWLALLSSVASIQCDIYFWSLCLRLSASHSAWTLPSIELVILTFEALSSRFETWHLSPLCSCIWLEVACQLLHHWMRTHISDDIKYKSMVLAFWDLTPVTASRL